MRVQIEFFGISRIITGKSHAFIDIPDGATYRTLVRVLANTYPKLIGNVIRPEKDTLQYPNVFHIQNNGLIKQDRFDLKLNPDHQIALMSLSAGG